MKFTSAFLVLAFSVTAFGQADDRGQVVPPYPIPAGEIALTSLAEIEINEDLLLTAYVEKDDRQAAVYVMGDLTAQVKCNKSASKIALSNFDVLKKEYPGGTGVRVYLAPKKNITLKFKTSLQGVEEAAPQCNGEPELCDGHYNTFNYRTQIIATDKTGNSSWNLNCVAPFSRPIFASDVKINGIKIK